MRMSPALKTVSIVALIGLCAFAAGVFAAGGGRQAKARIAAWSDAARKQAALLVKGEDAYVRDELDRNYRRQDAPTPAAPRELDTSRLPLTMEVLPLTAKDGFAASDDLVRGALAVVDGQVLAMDKLGNVFRLEERTLRRLDHGRFPSGIERYLVDTPRTLPRTAIRTLYLGYDAARRMLLVSHQRFVPQSRHVRFTISALPIDPTTGSRTGEWRILFESEDIPDASSFRGATGGKMVVSGDTLYFSIGDYNFGQVPQDAAALVAQDARSSFGKIHELDLATGRHKVRSIGHRNPQGLVLTRRGQLIDAEHGPEGGDELNLVRPGDNHGWPYRTYGTDYGTFNWPLKDPSATPRYTGPMYAWVPSAAISPVVEVADFDAAWDGDLLVGSLKAQTLYRLKLVDDRVVFAEPIWIGHRIRDIVIAQGRIVLMTDDPALVFLRIDAPRLAANTKLQKHVEFTPVLAGCLNCHHFGPTNPTHAAPSLGGIVGRRIAADGFERYSEALRRRQGQWDEASLARFIADPQAFAPGTSMPRPALTPQQVSEVVAALGRRAPEPAAPR